MTKSVITRTAPVRHWVLVTPGIVMIACAGPTDVPSERPPPGGQPPSLQLNPVPRFTNSAGVTITGTTASVATIEVSGGASLARGTADDAGHFSVGITLLRNQPNNLSVVAIASGGARSTAVTATVIQDDEPPTAPAVVVQAYTNQELLSVAGTTEAGASVLVVSPRDSMRVSADATGAFTATVRLSLNMRNDVQAAARDSAGNTGPARLASVSHDNVPPTLFVQSPNGMIVDTDGDARLNVAISYADSGGTGIDVSGLWLSNNRALGGGGTVGGLDADSSMAPWLDHVDSTGASRDVSRDHEFPPGSNTLTVRSGDRAGNTVTQTVTFDVPADPPTIAFVDDSSAIRLRFQDRTGRPDLHTLSVVGNRDLMGLLQQDGTKPADVIAGSDLGGLLAVSDSSAALSFGSRYSFGGGATMLTGAISDRVGNRSSDTINLSTPTPSHTLLVVNTSVGRGTAGHAIPIGLMNFISLAGLQFTLHFDSSVMVVDSLRTERVSFRAFHDADTNGRSGAVTIVLTDVQGDVIPEGCTVIVYVYVTVRGNAASGNSAATLSRVQSADTLGNPVALVVVNGYVTVQ